MFKLPTAEVIEFKNEFITLSGGPGGVPGEEDEF